MNDTAGRPPPTRLSVSELVVELEQWVLDDGNHSRFRARRNKRFAIRAEPTLTRLARLASGPHANGFLRAVKAVLTRVQGTGTVELCTLTVFRVGTKRERPVWAPDGLGRGPGRSSRGGHRHPSRHVRPRHAARGLRPDASGHPTTSARDDRVPSPLGTAGWVVEGGTP